MNQRFAVLSVVVLSLSLAATAMASAVKYDYDRAIDFSRWTKLAWQGPQDPQADMVEGRLEKAIEVGFSGRGYVLVAEPENADFVISYRAAAWQERRLEGWGGPARGRSLRVEREPKGALVINVFDRKTGKLAWHGVVSDALADDPRKADQRTAKAIEKLLKKFPARGGGQ